MPWLLSPFSCFPKSSITANLCSPERACLLEDLSFRCPADHWKAACSELRGGRAQGASLREHPPVKAERSLGTVCSALLRRARSWSHPPLFSVLRPFSLACAKHRVISYNCLRRFLKPSRSAALLYFTGFLVLL